MCKSSVNHKPILCRIRYIKPIDKDLLEDAYNNHSHIITVEDGTVIGGLYGAVAEYISEKDTPIRITPIGIPDRYITQSSQNDQRAECGLTAENIYKELLNCEA